MADDNSDVTLESSTSSPSPSTSEAGGSAASTTTPDPSPPPSSSRGEALPGSSEPPEQSTLKTAIDFLTKGDTPDVPPKKDDKEPAKPVDPKAKEQTEPAKPATPEPKDTDDPLSEDEKKRLGQHAQRRIVDLNTRWKAAESKIKELEPIVARGKAFDTVVEQFKLHQDLADLHPERGDADVAGAIKFNAALNRLSSGRGTQQDHQFVSAAFDAFKGTAEQLGILKPTQAPPEFDKAAILAAIEKAESEFDLTGLRDLAKKLKAAPVQQAAPVASTAPVQTPQQPQQNPQVPQGPDVDTLVYSSKLEDDIKGTGAKDVRAFYVEKVWPKVVADLQQRFPGQDPVKLYERASAQTRYQMSVNALQMVQKQEQALKPKPHPVAPSTPRPVTSQGTQKIGGSQPGSPLKAAINFLTIGE